MSGGHWNYSNHQASNFYACYFKNDPAVKERWPRLQKALVDMHEAMDAITHDIDYDLSGDSTIDDDREFEDQAIKNLCDVAKGLR